MFDKSRPQLQCGLTYWHHALWLGAFMSNDVVDDLPELTSGSDQLLAYALALCIQELRVSRQYVWHYRVPDSPELFDDEEDLQDLSDELRMEFGARGYNVSQLEDVKHQTKTLMDLDRTLACDMASEFALEQSSSFDMYERTLREIEGEAKSLSRAEGRQWKKYLQESYAFVKETSHGPSTYSFHPNKVDHLRRPKFNSLLKAARAIFRNAPETRVWFEIGTCVGSCVFVSSCFPIGATLTGVIDGLPPHFTETVPALAVLKKLAGAPSRASMLMRLRNECNYDEVELLAHWFGTQIVWQDMDLLNGQIVHGLAKAGGDRGACLGPVPVSISTGVAQDRNQSANQNHASTQPTFSVKRLKLTLIKDKGIVVRDGARITMTRPMHWKLLELLAKQQEGSFVSTNDLVAAAWEDSESGYSAVYSTLTHMRKELRPLGITINCLKGIGYELAVRP